MAFSFSHARQFVSRRSIERALRSKYQGGAATIPCFFFAINSTESSSIEWYQSSTSCLLILLPNFTPELIVIHSYLHFINFNTLISLWIAKCSFSCFMENRRPKHVLTAEVLIPVASNTDRCYPGRCMDPKQPTAMAQDIIVERLIQCRTGRTVLPRGVGQLQWPSPKGA
ncbi:hypothetical protein OUZ56_006531 [Daphnia magna]|uniref:Uncharacterized protein n=1 Tax=Daphnia magna TaxID=35525 RepID=A0ABQ9YVX7_9CRUS|nr:hypothetical protein OUZ56_006531 [Daphnia magna]